MPVNLARSARRVAFAGAVALMLGTAPAALAAGDMIVAQQQFTEVQIQAFAEAAQEVGELQRRFDEQAQAADTPEEIAELEQQTQMRMVQAVEESGLTPEEYNQILQAAHEDPELYEEILAHMEGAQ